MQPSDDTFFFRFRATIVLIRRIPAMFVYVNCVVIIWSTDFVRCRSFASNQRNQPSRVESAAKLTEPFRSYSLGYVHTHTHTHTYTRARQKQMYYSRIQLQLHTTIGNINITNDETKQNEIFI